MIIESLDGVGEFDSVIVGAGTVGLYLANILVKRGLTVLCIEEGGLTLEPTIQEQNNCRQLGHAHTGTINARARMVGGTSNLWGGQLTKFREEDFSGRFGLDWGCTFSDLNDLYKKVGEDLGVNSLAMSDDEILRELGLSDIKNSSIEFYYTHWLKEPNFRIFYSKMIKENANFKIAINSKVTKIVLDDAGARVKSLIVLTSDGGRQIEVLDKRVYLSSGTMENVYLLLNSMKDEKINRIGRGFQDHIDVDCAKINIKNQKKFKQYFLNAFLKGNKIQPRLRLTTTGLGSSINVASSLKFSSSIRDDVDALKTLLKGVARGRGVGWKAVAGSIRALKVLYPMIVEYMKNRRIHEFFDGGVTVRAHIEQRPNNGSCLDLDENTTDAFGNKALSVCWDVDWGETIDALRSYTNNLKDFLEVSGIGTLEIMNYVLERDVEELKSKSRDSYHQCGGVSCQKDDGVVELNGSFKGIENLGVVGACVFPNSSYANPTLTALAMCHLQK